MSETFSMHIQHALFGVIDEYTLDKRLKEFKSRVDTITHSYDASATAINVIQHNIKQMKAAVIQLNHRFANGGETDKLRHFSLVAFFISNVKPKLQILVSERTHIIQAILTAAKGIVEPALISPTDIQGILVMLR